MKTDVMVLGAGPAGVSAAIAAADAGAEVIVVDENPQAGGKLLGQLHEETPGNWWVGAQVARELAARATAAGVRLLSNRQVWALTPGWHADLDGGERISAEHVVVATGAAERALPMPGWTLPGVMAIGAAQTLTNYYRVRPGDRIAVVGIDPLSLTVANELSMAGAEVVGIYLPVTTELSTQSADPERNLASLAAMSHLAPNVLLRWGGRLARIAALRQLALPFFPRSGLPLFGTRLHLRSAVVGIGGEEQAEYVEVARIDSHGNTGVARRVSVDCVCLSGGLYPVQELTTGCELSFIEQLGGMVPLHSPELETSQAGLFVAGNVTGIEGATIAMAQGTLAGTAIAARLGLTGPDRVAAARLAVDRARAASAITFTPDIRKGRELAQEQWTRLASAKKAARERRA